MLAALGIGADPDGPPKDGCADRPPGCILGRMGRLRQLTVFAVPGLTGTGCSFVSSTSSTSSPSPLPEVHLVIELRSASARSCCTVVLTNPTAAPVFALCELTVYEADGTIRSAGALPTPPSGLQARPGRREVGSINLSSEPFRLDPAHDRYEARCRAVAWTGDVPI